MQQENTLPEKEYSALSDASAISPEAQTSGGLKIGSETASDSIRKQPTFRDSEHELTVFQKIPDHSGKAVSNVQWDPILSGWSNQNFKVTLKFDSDEEPKIYFVKKMMPYSKAYQSRTDEIKNLRALADCSFCPRLIAVNVTLGWQIFNYLGDYRPLSADDFSDKIIQENVSRALASLHSISPFHNTINIFKRTNKVLEYLQSRDTEIEKAHFDLLNLILLMSESLKENANTIRPCHNDTTPSNFLLGHDNSIQIIDYENAGNNDSAFDPAYASVEVRMDEKQEAEFVATYLERSGTQDDKFHDRLTLYKLVVMHWISLWTKLQSVESNPSQDQSVFELKSKESLHRASLFSKTEVFKAAWHSACKPESQASMLELVAQLN